MTTAAEKKAQEAAAAEAAAAEAPSSSGDGDRELVVIKHPGIEIPAITTRKVAEGVYKTKGWTIDKSTSLDDARTAIAEARNKLKG